MAPRARVVGGAAGLCAVLVVSVAFAASGDPNGTPATASGVKQKVKKLSQRVQELQQQLTGLQEQLATLQAEQGGARPPSGPAGGDLAGTYPDPQVAAGAVDSAKIANDSVTGADVVENTLGIVPEAQNAGSVGGVQVFQIEFNVGASTGTTTVFSPPGVGGFTIDASCDAGSDLIVEANGPAAGDLIMSYSTDAVTGATGNLVYQALPGVDINLFPSGDDDDLTGHTVYRLGNSVLTIEWAADNSGLQTCEFNGVATLH